jgi:hypothetical protein
VKRPAYSGGGETVKELRAAQQSAGRRFALRSGRFDAFGRQRRFDRRKTKKKGRRKAVPSSSTTPTRRFIQAKSLRRSRAAIRSPPPMSELCRIRARVVLRQIN